MAFVLADRVKETTIVVGTGAATLLGASSGYQSFSAGVGASNTTYYTIADQSGSNWEVGYGTLDVTGLILTRTTVISSSNSGSAVTFTTGTKDVWCDYTAKKAVTTDTLAYPPAIGSTTPAAGKFTTLEATGTSSLGTASAQYIQAVGDALYPQLLAAGSGTNIPLVLSPLGTGALQAQKTDSTATGGNARGANAVDWQTSRTTAAQVASGTQSVISGGQNNTVSAQLASVVGGFNNNNQSYLGFIGGGLSNSTGTSFYSYIVGGQANQAVGYYNFIGAGFTNSATSASAVTTNTTTIALTAATTVYLSSTNANIKVGQLITGTGFTFATYATSTVTTGTPAVMNTSTISGTTLTVGSLASGTIIAGQVLTGTGVTAGTYIVSGAGSSWTVSASQTVTSTTITGTAYTFTINQNATTTAGITLSFYTPHGVVVGGGNNQATGSYSFIGGGGDAGTAANRNTASGDWSVVVGGQKNTASGIASFVGGGGTDGVTPQPNIASGTASVVCGGQSNTSSGQFSFVGGGASHNSNATGSAIMGGSNGTTRSINANQVFPARNPLTSPQGASQAALLVLARQTTDATATALSSDSSAAGTTNQVILPNNSAYYFKVRVIAGVTGAGNTKAWTLEGAIKRGANAASTAIVGTVTTTIVAADAGASTWTVTATADTTNGGLAITVTGQASTTIRWVAKAETAEMTF